MQGFPTLKSDKNAQPFEFWFNIISRQNIKKKTKNIVIKSERIPCKIIQIQFKLLTQCFNYYFVKRFVWKNELVKDSTTSSDKALRPWSWTECVEQCQSMTKQSRIEEHLHLLSFLIKSVRKMRSKRVCKIRIGCSSFRRSVCHILFGLVFNSCPAR